MASENSYKYLPANMAERLHTMEFAVRRAMDGHYQGLHHSNAFGSSVEFAEYREYIPGDPVSRIDWPVYARSDRYVIRQYHEDVSIRCHILLDTSSSMAYHNSGIGGLTKLEYSCYLAAGMAYAMTRQGDSVSLITFDNQIIDHVGPASNYIGLKPLLQSLDAVQPAGKSDLEAVLHKVAELVKGKALIVVISDLLDEPNSILTGMRHLYHEGKELSVYHVLDPAELRLPADAFTDGVSMADIECMETGEKVLVDLDQVKESYQDQVHGYLNELRQGVMNIRGQYVLAETNREIYDVLLERSRAV